MKKLSLAMAVSAALAAGTANAYNLGVATSGLMVPNVIHNGGTDTTAVGMVARSATNVFWVFFDENSNHVTDGQFAVTANDVAPFIWATEAGLGLDGVRGYLVFTMDGTSADGVLAEGETTNVMTGNAFHVTPGDVAYVPALPLMAGALDSATANSSAGDYVLPVTLSTMTGASIRAARLTGVRSSTVARPTSMDIRYFIDGTVGNADTTYITFWTADEFTVGVVDTWTANMYDTAQNRKSINFVLTNDNQNTIDVEGIVGRPATFLDGFINVPLPTLAAPGLQVAGVDCAVPFDWTGAAMTANCTGGVLAYSVVVSSVFGAAQTLLAGHN